jgi:hypothetical protein
VQFFGKLLSQFVLIPARAMGSDACFHNGAIPRVFKTGSDACFHNEALPRVFKTGSDGRSLEFFPE